jgi:hypothetical protein
MKQARAIRPTHHFLKGRHEMGVNGATDIVTNANPPPRNPDTVSSKEVKEVKEFKETKETVDRSTTSNDSSEQSQGTSNSYPIILATRPPINLATAARPYAGETPQPHSTGNQEAEVDAVSQADAAPEGAKKVPADTAQKTEPDTGTSPPKKAADDDDTPHREINAQALVVGNKSSDGKHFGSLDVSESVVWKNTNLGPEAKLGSRTEVSMGHEPQISGGVSLQMRNHDDATTPGGPPAVSTHVQVQGSIGIVNVTRKDDNGHDSVEGELDAAVGVDLYGGKKQFQASLLLTGEKHFNDKSSLVIQVNIPVGDQPQPPSGGIGFKMTF